jgi:hypothetical protein
MYNRVVDWHYQLTASKGGSPPASPLLPRPATPFCEASVSYLLRDSLDKSLKPEHAKLILHLKQHFSLEVDKTQLHACF